MVVLEFWWANSLLVIFPVSLIVRELGQTKTYGRKEQRQPGARNRRKDPVFLYPGMRYFQPQSQKNARRCVVRTKQFNTYVKRGARLCE